MFAPPLAKPKAMQLKRPKAMAQRADHSAVSQAQMLRQSIGNRNQAMSGLLAPCATALRNAPEVHEGMAHAAASSWDFGKIPVFSPDGAERLQNPPPFPALRYPISIQAKLKIGAVDDPLEHAADRAAHQVMRTPEPRLRRICACGGECPRCQTEKPDQAPAHLRTSHVGSGDLESTVAPPIVHEVLRSPGQPLDAATRAFMEPRFGHDFSRVRVHTDARAAASAEAVHARAYTVGSNVAFGANQYAPANARGRELLAHELAHTIQQQRSPGSTASGIGLARKPADADNDDEPDSKPTARPDMDLSRFAPGGFTDEEADKVSREAEQRLKLGSLALDLAEKQARRRAFWDSNPSNNDADVTEAFALDLYWDPKEEGFIRQPYVDKMEAVVLADPEARLLYNNRLWDLTENKPEEKSRFNRAVGFVCEHTEPCSSNIEQFRRDRDSGMSRDEALNRGMARLVVAAEVVALPSPGPSGPIEVGPGGRPTGMPSNVPATEGAGVGGAEKPAPPTSKPLLTTGPKSGEPPAGGAAPPAAVPEPITDEPATNPIPRGAEVGEPVGDYRIYGEKGLKGKTFEREIWGLKSNQKPTTDIGVGPLLKLFKNLMAEARAAGADQLRIVGRVVRNENILKMKGLVEKYGGTFRRVDATTVEIEIPLSK
ncbi:DUF4157 domain-containing protein [Bradyrhizobium sp.]|uniref:eCIS core domain-containing protein n=1 Tax=Bradyrhizobium sp. TaxID=376 RepID=UPI003C21489C